MTKLTAASIRRELLTVHQLVDAASERYNNASNFTPAEVRYHNDHISPLYSNLRRAEFLLEDGYLEQAAAEIQRARYGASLVR